MMVYFLLGLVLGFVIEFLNERMGSPETFGWRERIVIVMLWPIFLFIFIFNLF
jgi:hypothetical protein